MPRRYTRIFPVTSEGIMKNIPSMDAAWTTLKSRVDNGRLRKRPGVVRVDSDDTPAASGDSRLLVEHEPSDVLSNEEILRPDADGNYDDYDGTPWSVSGGGSEGYSKINEVTLDVLSYLQNSQVTTLDTTKNSFTFADLTETFDSISHVKITFVATDTSPAAHDCTYTLNVFSRQGGSDDELTTYDETDFPFNTQQTKEIVLYNSPDDSSAWEAADVNGFEVGFYFSAYAEGTPSTILRIYQMYITVVGEISSSPNTKIMVTSQGFQSLNEALTTWADIQGATTNPSQPALRRWDWTKHEDTLYFVNGSDEVYYFPNSGVMGQLSGEPVGRCCATFGSSLFMGDVLDSSVRYNSRIYWSVAGDATDFSSATSGNRYLDETPGRVVSLMPIAEKANTYIGVLVALKEKGIYHIYATGDTNDPYNHRLMNGSVGCDAVNAVVPVTIEGREMLAFLGRDGERINIYGWDGNNAIPLGNPIRQELEDEVNFTRIQDSFAGYDQDGGNLVFAIPTSTNNYPTKAWVFNIERGIWSTWPLPAMTAFGVWKINDRWQQVIGKADNLSYEFDITAKSDQGSVAIAEEMTTGDLVLNQEAPWVRNTVFRVWIYYHARGTATLSVDGSTDGGINFSTTRTVTLDSDDDDDGSLQLAKADMQLNGYTHRIRLKANTAAEELDLVAVILEWESESKH